MKTALLLLLILLAPAARVAPVAQEAAARVEHFSKDGLSFDYPSGWTLTENSNEQLQNLYLGRAGSSTLIIVSAQRAPFTSAEQVADARGSVTLPYVENIARRLGLEAPPPSESQCVEVGGSSAVGFRMAGRVKGEPMTAEVYPVVLGQRLLHLAHIRADREEAQSAPAWKALLDTVSVVQPGAVKIVQPGAEAVELKKFSGVISGGMLNTKAVNKPQPRYPAEAKWARAQGTVMVQIVVDESGNVTYATALTGHRSLRPAGEEAARRAKFTPTLLCGKPVKVTGVITYNFVLR